MISSMGSDTMDTWTHTRWKQPLASHRVTILRSTSSHFISCTMGSRNASDFPVPAHGHTHTQASQGAIDIVHCEVSADGGGGVSWVAGKGGGGGDTVLPLTKAAQKPVEHPSHTQRTRCCENSPVPVCPTKSVSEPARRAGTASFCGVGTAGRGGGGGGEGLHNKLPVTPEYP
jgi:hypothetical protein